MHKRKQKFGPICVDRRSRRNSYRSASQVVADVQSDAAATLTSAIVAKEEVTVDVYCAGGDVRLEPRLADSEHVWPVSVDQSTHLVDVRHQRLSINVSHFEQLVHLSVHN